MSDKTQTEDKQGRKAWKYTVLVLGRTMSVLVGLYGIYMLLRMGIPVLEGYLLEWLVQFVVSWGIISYPFYKLTVWLWKKADRFE